MVSSKTFKQLSIAAVALILGMVTVARQETASAVTFSFQGERQSLKPPQFMEPPIPFTGKFTIDDDFFRTLAEDSFVLDTLAPVKVRTPIFAPSASLELTIGDRGTVSATGLNLQPAVGKNVPSSSPVYYFYTSLANSGFFIKVTPECLKEFKCSGYLSIDVPILVSLPFVASNIKSVPEQNSAIAISMMGTLMFMLKRKKNITSQYASDDGQI